MPAYELREHRTDHGYNVLGKYATVDEAWAHKGRLEAEDPQRVGRYMIHHDQHGTPDTLPDVTAANAATPEQEDFDMTLRRTKAPPADLPEHSAADMVDSATVTTGLKPDGTAADAVDAVRGKEPTVSAAAKTAGARKP